MRSCLPLRSAVLEYGGNGGVFSTPVLAVPPEAAADEGAVDADCEAPPPLARHRLLDDGFRLKSKAFMLTYNSRGFSEGTWPVFLKWAKERRRALAIGNASRNRRQERGLKQQQAQQRVPETQDF